MADQTSASFQEIRNLYLTLERNFDDLYFATGDPQERKRIREAYGAARSAYDDAVKVALDDGEPRVKELTAELKTANIRISGALENLQKTAGWVDLIAKASGLAVKLVRFA